VKNIGYSSSYFKFKCSNGHVHPLEHIQNFACIAQNASDYSLLSLQGQSGLVTFNSKKQTLFAATIGIFLLSTHYCCR
jgi:hypothetical protein